MNCGIYLIKNVVNGKVYVGSSINITNRWSWHKNALKRGNHHSIYLQRAWNKHGKESFSFETIEEVKNKHHLQSIEQIYLDYFKAGKSEKCFNICPIAGTCLGTKLTEAHKKNISKNHGSKNLNGKPHWRKGKKHSEETKRKMSETRRGENNVMFGKRGIRAENSPHTELAWEDVDEMRRMWENKEANQKQLSEMYDVSHSTVNRIVRYKVWVN